MANFMGPMAPPQAAPNAPPQLDIRTNPTQRAQFKSFMQDMGCPAAPPTTAPIAPMLPAPMPSPMDQIDIFAPAPMASGGVVGGLNKLNQMSDQMVEALNAVVYGGDPGGGGFGGGRGGPMSSGGGFGGGQMPAPLPPIAPAPFTPTPPNPSGPTFGTMPHHFSGGSGPVIDTFALPDNYVGNPAPNIPAPNFEERISSVPINRTPGIGGFGSSAPPVTTNPLGDDRDLSLNDMSLLGMPTPQYMPMDPDGDGMDQQGRPMESQLTDAERTQAEQDQQDRITSLRSTLNNQDSAFGSGSMGNPLARLGGIGAGLGSIFGYEDGGPVGMRRGGVTFKSGESFESGRGIAEQQAERRARNESYFGDIPSYGGSEPPSGGGDDGGSERPITKNDPITQAEVNAAFDASNNSDSGSGSVLTGNLVSDPAPAANIGPSGQIFAPTTPITEESGQRAIDAVMSIPGVAPVAPIAAPTMDVIDPMTDLLAGEPGTSGAGNDSLSAALNRLYSTPITNMRGGEKRSAAEDLLIRTGRADMPTDSGGGFPSLAKIAVDALTGIGKDRAGKVADNIEMGRPAVIDARSGQITGYVGEGLFGIGNSYTGRPGYDPFGPNATFDPSRNAYIVQPDISTGDSDERALPQTPVTPPPATDPADTTPPPLMITPPTTGLPPSGPSPTDVLVPSTRTNVPITAPSLLPSEGLAPTFLPQSFLDLLASFNRPAPRAMQDGGAVLDKAADNFLEALRVA